MTRAADRVLSPLIGKSLVLYLSKPSRRWPDLPDAKPNVPRGVPGVGGPTPRRKVRPHDDRRRLRSDEAPSPRCPASSARPTCWPPPTPSPSVQRADGMIPWFDGGHCDPWNHVEAAMALSVCGLVERGHGAYRWLAERQLPDGSWFNYYQGTGVKDQRLDTNVCAYLAAGAWHHHLITGDVEFLGELWPTIERGIDFILRWQQPDGSVLWSLDSAGRPEEYALLTGSSSIYHSTAVRRGRGRVPGQGSSGLGAGRRPAGPRRGPPPQRLRSQGRVRHGLVLPHALGGARRRGRSPPPGRGLVDLRHGGPRRALRLDQRLGHGGGDGRVRAGPRRPGHGRATPWTSSWPGRTCACPTAPTGRAWSTRRGRPSPTTNARRYTFAAMVLAADALSSTSPAAGLFRGECLPAALDLAEPHCTGDAGAWAARPARPALTLGRARAGAPPGAAPAGCRIRRPR